MMEIPLDMLQGTIDLTTKVTGKCHRLELTNSERKDDKLIIFVGKKGIGPVISTFTKEGIFILIKSPSLYMKILTAFPPQQKQRIHDIVRFYENSGDCPQCKGESFFTDDTGFFCVNCAHYAIKWRPINENTTNT